MTNEFRQQLTQMNSPGQRDILAAGRPVEDYAPVSVEAPEIADAQINSADNQEIKEDPFLANLNQKFSQEVAILYVEAEGDHYYFHAHNAVLGSLEVDPEIPPRSLNAQIQAKQPLRTIMGEVRAFSQNRKPAKKLRGWLMHLKQVLEEERNTSLSYLIIHDRTVFEIPWEMLDWDARAPIGAIIPTVRWQQIPDLEDLEADPPRNLSLETQKIQCRGQVRAYVNERELPSVRDELTVIEQLNSICHTDVCEFLDDFEQATAAVSLLFIASHGFSRDDGDVVAFGEQNSDNQRITLSDLHNWNLPAFQNFPIVVFMNACHSSRLFCDELSSTFDPEYLTGLPTFFLQRGAKGVIGTMGKVFDSYAARIACKFFEECQRDPQLTVAEILRNLRAEAAGYLRTRKSDENLKLFLSTFMYVYYGHPLTYLQFNSSEELDS